MLTKFASWFAAALAASLYAGAPMHAGDLGTPLAPKPVWTAEGEQVYSSFGNSVASAGDVNGDGYADVVVGAPFVSHGESFEGRAFVYYGSANGLPTLPDWIAEGDLEEAQFGSVVASAGDVNGDGYDDVLVGAPTFDHGKTSEGRAFLYLGSANGLALTPAWHAESHQKFARFGAGVAGAGDVNGDGFVDVLVGADSYDNGESDEGRVYLFLGSKTDLGHPASWTTESNDSYSGFGHSVSSAGDVNSDGFSDIIIGSFGIGGSPSLVHLGSPVGLGPTPVWTAQGNQEFASFGYSVATAGDVDGDGYSDVLVGAPGFKHGEAQEGRAFLYRGTATGVALTESWTAESDQIAASFGCSVGTAGDLNGDGFSDVIVGAFRFDGNEFDEGRTYAFLGSAAGLAPSPAWMSKGSEPWAGFGLSVATAGDINADGFSDVVVGAYAIDDDNPHAGRAYVYFGAPPSAAFVPGDRLHGTFTAPNDLTAAAFDGIAGMKLRLDFGVSPTPQKLRLRLLAADGSVAKQSTLHLGDESVTKILKLQKSGPYALRLTLLGGTPGAFDITTSRSLPTPPKSEILKPKTGKTTASLTVHALPGARLDVKLTKKDFAGTINVSMAQPDKTTFDVSSFTTTGADGSVTLTDVPCGIVGVYTLTVSGFANSGETIKAKATLTQPAPGDADVSLP